jgi:hypothetical protein
MRPLPPSKRGSCQPFTSPKRSACMWLDRALSRFAHASLFELRRVRGTELRLRLTAPHGLRMASMCGWRLRHTGIASGFHVLALLVRRRKFIA